MHFLTIIDGHIHLYTWFDGDASKLLDNIRWSVQVDETLMDAHFESIPSIGTFSRGSLTGGDLQNLGGHANGSAHVELLVQGDLLQVRTHLLDVGHIARSQSNADSVNLGGRGLWVLVFLGWVGRHDGCC